MDLFLIWSKSKKNTRLEANMILENGVTSSTDGFQHTPENFELFHFISVTFHCLCCTCNWYVYLILGFSYHYPILSTIWMPLWHKSSINKLVSDRSWMRCSGYVNDHSTIWLLQSYWLDYFFWYTYSCGRVVIFMLLRPVLVQIPSWTFGLHWHFFSMMHHFLYMFFQWCSSTAEHTVKLIMKKKSTVCSFVILFYKFVTLPTGANLLRG
jgi:hypothetical protein